MRKNLIFGLLAIMSQMQSMALPIVKCQEYLEIHESLNCKDSHYPKNYGYKYCKRFENLINNQLSTQGKEWSQKTKSCLLNSLKEKISQKNPTCRKLKRYAFKDHPRCYVDSGFCELSTKDLKIISAHVRQKFSLAFLSQALKTYWLCHPI